MRLEHRADLVDLEDLARVLVQPGPDERRLRSDEPPAATKRPRVPAGLEQAERLEARERLAQDGAGDAELLDELALGRQPVAGRELRRAGSAS